MLTIHKSVVNLLAPLLGFADGGVILGASLIIAGIIINVATNSTGALLNG